MKPRLAWLLAAALCLSVPVLAQPAPPAPDDDDGLAGVLFVESLMAPDDDRGGGMAFDAPAPPMGMGGGMSRGMDGPMHGGAMGPGGPGGPGMRGMRGGMRGRMAMLDLTRDQRERLADIRDAAERRNVPIRSDLQLAQLDLRRALRAERVDRTAVRQQVERISELRGRLMASRMDAMLDARGVLTDAQRDKLRSGPDRGPGMAPPAAGKGRAQRP